MHEKEDQNAAVPEPDLSPAPCLGDEQELAIGTNRKLTFSVPESSTSRFAAKLRYWWCWVVAGTLLLLVGLPSLVVLGIIGRKMWLHPVARIGADLWLKACGASVCVTGGELLSPDETYIFVSNHRSYLDTATLFFHTGWKMGLVAKRELLKVPVLGQGMHYVNIFAIDRSNPERARRSMEKARRVTKDGISFGIFAEGTRAMPGELLPFKKGAFHLAKQTGSMVVPVAIKNTDRMMGKRAGLAFPGTIEMVLLPPIDVEGRDVNGLLLETRARIAEELSRSGNSAPD